MIAKTLVFVCAAFGLVAGSCFEVQQQCSPCAQQQQVFNLPVQAEPQTISCGSFAPVSTPVFTEQAPVSCGNSEIFSSGSSCGSSFPVSVLSSGSSCGSSCGSSFPVSVVSSGSSCGSSCGSSFPVSVLSSGSSCGNSFSDSFSSGSFSSGSSGYCGVQPTNGPESGPVSVLQAPAVTLPAVEAPVITLSSQPIPAPRVLSQRCVCTKTIVKPQVYQRLVTVPKIQRYIKRTVTPVVENVSYKSTPITQESSCGSSSIVVSGSGSGSCGSSRMVSAPVVVSSGSSCPRMC